MAKQAFDAQQVVDDAYEEAKNKAALQFTLTAKQADTFGYLSRWQTHDERYFVTAILRADKGKLTVQLTRLVSSNA